jgi:hypothetical protein
VLPVAGLLAATGKTLRQQEFATLAALATAPRDEMDDVLMSTSRFLRSERVAALSAVSTEQRHALLARLGLYGLRLSMMHIRQGCHDATALAAELLRGSGITELCDVLRVRFTERRDLLKARSGLLAVERVLRTAVPGTDPDAVAGLADEVERISSGAHEFVELRLLSSLRCGDVTLEADTELAERLLGGDGVSATRRLALTPDAPARIVRKAALAELDRWRRRAENPFANRDEVRVYRAVARSCEGIVAELARTDRLVGA